MTTLADIRTRVRKDLRDTDAANYRWSDTQLDRHIERALGDLSLAIPREATATLATTPGSRELSLGALSGLLDLEAVEYPAGHYPPTYIGFSRWASTLTLHTETVPNGENARLYYTARHTLDGSGTTVPPEFEDLLAMGAAAYAANEQAAYLTNRVSTDGSAPEDFRALALAWETAFRQLLATYARRNRVRARRLLTPAH